MPFQLRLGCQNVRTLLDTPCKRAHTRVNPPRRTAICDLQFRRAKADIVALSETRLSGSGSRCESYCTFYWSGRPQEHPRTEGVGFALSKRVINLLIGSPTAISSRVMSIRLKATKHRNITVLSAYAPTFKSDASSKDAFFQDLQKAIDDTSKSDLVFLLGDFNARVGSDWKTWSRVIGSEGVGEGNESGLKLLEFCSRNGLCITNTYFAHKPHHKTTWMHPRSKQWHMIDFVITRQRDRRFVRNTRVYRSIDCWSDHCFVGSSIYVPGCHHHHTSAKKQKAANVLKLEQSHERQHYIDTLSQYLATISSQHNARSPIKSSQEVIDDHWKQLSSAFQTAVKESIGFRRSSVYPDWFQEHIETISPLLDQKRKLYKQMLDHKQSEGSDYVDLVKRYKCVKNKVKNSICRIQNKWWSMKAEEMNQMHSCRDWKGLFDIWKKLSLNHSKSGNVATIRDSSGNNILTDRLVVNDRWREYFANLLNTNIAHIDHSILSKVTQHPVANELADPPTLDEVVRAVMHFKKMKAAGRDGIMVELIQHGGPMALKALHSLISTIWESEFVPQEWVEAVIVPLPKKGNLQICDNWRGISLLSVPGKIFGRIIAERVQKLAETIIDETQCGFRKMRGCNDMVFVARQVQEKAREQQCSLNICFFDIKKAYDTVNRDILWPLLLKCGLPLKVVTLIRKLHEGMKAVVRVKDTFTEPFDVLNGLKQGCVLAPFLFNLFFDQVIHTALSGYEGDVQLNYKIDGKLFRRSGCKLPLKMTITELRFADDLMATCHSQLLLQDFINRFTKAAKTWGLEVSTTKSKVMIQQSGLPSTPASFFYQ